MNDRMKRLMCLMEQEGMNALLVADRFNVRYFSGFTGDTAYLYISAKRRVLLTDSRYTTWAKEEVNGFEIFQVDRQTPYQEKIRQLAEEEKIKCIGFENRKMIYSDVQDFCAKLPDVKWHELDGRLDSLRSVKDGKEQEAVCKAAKIADKAFSHIVQKLCVGITEKEAAWELACAMRKYGAEGLSFETIAVFGERTAMPHAVPGERKLKKGDFALMDFGCIYHGYCSDMTRTVVMGAATERQKEIYETVLEAQCAALSVIKAGTACCEVDAAARNVIEKAGYGSYFGHGLGHSVGLFIHEAPSLSPKDETVLQDGMLETIEPGIYIPDFGGVRIEDLVLVTQNGCKNLTKSNKELMQL